MGFLFFRIIAPLLLLTIQYVLLRRTLRWLKEQYPSSAWMKTTAISMFAVFNLAFLAVALFRPRITDFPDWFLYAGVYPFYTWHTATFIMGVVLLLATIVRSPFRLGSWVARKTPVTRPYVERVRSSASYQQFDVARRQFLRLGMYGLTGVAFGGTAFGLTIGKRRLDITEATFAIPNLAPELNGFTIALASDIHSSVFMTQQMMETCVQTLNSLQADLIAVTGDFVNSLTEEVYPFAEAFSGLNAPHGVYGVMGNHDFFAPNPDVVAKEIDDCGLRLLRDDKVVIEKNGGKFYLVGIDDAGRPERAAARMDAAIANAHLPIPRILLCHRPYFLQQAAERNIDLTLSGHTHGGQIVLGRFSRIVLAPAAIASGYVWGKYALGNSQMYVSRGVGTVGPPIRINCPPEITRIRLVRAA